MLMKWMAAAAASLVLVSANAVADIGFEHAGLPENGIVVIPAGSDLVLPDIGLAQADADYIVRALEAADFSGEAGAMTTLYAVAEFDQVVVVGRDDLDRAAAEALGGSLINLSRDAEATVSLVWPETLEQSTALSVALGAGLGDYRFDRYLSDRSDYEPELIVHLDAPDEAQAAFNANHAPIIEATAFARDLINAPGNEIYPQVFVERTQAAFEGERNVSIRVLDVADMQELGMGALLGVGLGSSRPPRLLVVEYTGGASGDAPIAFVGKGVTFDSGGISIKGRTGMWRMKYDLAGASASVAAVLALARRDAGVNAIAVAPLVENMPSGTAQRPGDVVTTLSGQTIEIFSTDAEGRLILADAVRYAQDQYNPSLMIDIATLTGSIRTALGREYAGLFSRHDDVARRILDAGEEVGEILWRLPLDPSYADDIASPIADIRNTGGDGAGAGIGAQVIASFVDEDTAWAHIDMANVGWAFSSSPTVPEGGVGWGVRLFDAIARQEEARD
ncbi:leucyl aminopeptidase [Hyphobacterium sp.]|uniref:leucyl aminopeptidase n=1 Tax=Hyphobacterium sp. TaxID=2004662 RepID=UPI003B524A29